MNVSPSRVRTTPQSSRTKCSQMFITPNKLINTKSMQHSCDSKKSYYEKSCCGHVTRTQYNNFLIDIQNEIKRLDSSVELNFDEKTVFAKVLSVIRQSVDYIMLIQSSLSNADWVDLENFKSSLKLQEAKLKNESEKIRITSRHLDQYDNLLKSKEEQLKNDEKILKSKLELLRQEDLYNEELKLKCIQLEQELRLLKKQKITENTMLETSLNSEIDCLKIENSKLKKIISNKSEIIYYDEESLTERMLMDKNKSNPETTKSATEIRILNTENEEHNSKSQSIDLGKLTIPDIESSDCPSRFSEASFGNKEDKYQNTEIENKNFEDKILIPYQNESELKSYLSEVLQSIEEYNQEVEIREKILREKSLELEEKENNLNKQIIDMKLIDNSISNSKTEILEFYSTVMPSFEEYSQALSQLLADLYMKKQEYTEYAEKAEKIIEDLESNVYYTKEESDYQTQEFENKILEIQEKQQSLIVYEKNLIDKEQSLNQNINEAIIKMTNELQLQLEKVQNKEKEVEHIKEKLENEKSENEKIAMMLKVAHLEFENNKIKENEKIRIKKEKLRILKAKLESNLKAIESKEPEERMRLSLDLSQIATRSHSFGGLNEKNIS
ncbi:hypothetical protein SteCoe_4491 [Stentor coeruleus]|uniref:Uncharacterized protein n=1 Tax=Stentor coeruleus TaxID=5963 RepID=A0A1R2CUQ2_9CILI|nr:hypothetical protein SteCoe_4491 [Stentor coeruleus]